MSGFEPQQANTILINYRFIIDASRGVTNSAIESVYFVEIDTHILPSYLFVGMQIANEKHSHTNNGHKRAHVYTTMDIDTIKQPD